MRSNFLAHAIARCVAVDRSFSVHGSSRIAGNTGDGTLIEIQRSGISFRSSVEPLLVKPAGRNSADQYPV